MGYSVSSNADSFGRKPIVDSRQVMTFQDLLTESAKIKCEEMRAREEDYCEIVVGNSEIPRMVSLLDSYFGIPFKAAGVEAAAEADRLADPFGGVQSNQTMYFRKGNDVSEFAFLWPWGSGMSTTVKIIRK